MRRSVLGIMAGLFVACGDIVLPGNGTDTGGVLGEDTGGTTGTTDTGAPDGAQLVCTFGDSAACDDGDSCTEDRCNAKGECVHTPVTEGCQIAGECYPAGAVSDVTVCKVCDPARRSDDWSSVVCDDGKPCTKDLCDATTGCTAVADDQATCDDGLACTTDDHCASGACVATPCACAADADCGTAAACRVNRCVEGFCASEASASLDGQACDDGDACTASDACAAGVCAGAALDCSSLDGPCVTGVCVGGSCAPEQAPEGATCSDPCRSDAACDADGNCAGVWNVAACGCDDDLQCDDALDCTADACDDGGACTHTLATGWCHLLGQCFAEGAPQPGNACLVCDPLAEPEAGAGAGGGAFVARSCGDDDPCTQDGCDPASGCTAAPVTSPPAGQAGACCHSDGDCSGVAVDACHVGRCQDKVCAAVAADDGAPCSDGDACTESDACAAGACVGQAKDCSAWTGPCHAGVCQDGACGAEPTVNAGCDDGDSCTINDHCAADGSCAGDYACACTQDADCAAVSDACNSAACGADGTCVRTPREGATCDDGNPCTAGDVCDAAGACGGAAYACDALSCQSAACDGVGGCSFTVKAGSCVIDGACVAAGTLAPGNACRLCDPSTSTSVWSARPDGTACDADGNGCTAADSCQAGACLPGAPAVCEDGKQCTKETCVSTGPTAFSCTVEANGLGCFIDGACIAAGTPRPGTPCQACLPELSASAWSPRPNGTACDADGDGCTVGDACAAGVCKVGTGAAPCDDGKACTTNTCTSTGATTYTCSTTVAPGSCFIGGACVAAGAPAPGTACQACNPAQSNSAWSPVNDGTSCDADGNGCTVGDACAGGVCKPGAAAVCNDGLSCTVDTCQSTGAATHTCAATIATGCVINGACVASGTNAPGNPCQVCDVAKSASGWSPSADGVPCDADNNGCTAGDACAAGACAPGAAVTCNDDNSCTLDQCVSSGATTYTCKNQNTSTSCNIGGVCVADGARNPQNGCQICDPARSTSAWSTRPDGAACDADGNGCTVGDQCLAGVCKAGAPPNCDDAKTCTADACTSTGSDAYVCAHTANGSGCFIAGACVAEGTVEPGNVCRECHAATSASGWSPRPVGTACGDTATACRYADACDGAGACADKGFVAAGMACGEGPTACSGQDTCNGGGTCQPNHKASGTACGDAASACVNADSCDGNGACQDAGFRPNGTPCDADNNGCTQNDACSNGACSPGAAPGCSDGLSCTADACVSTGTNGYQCAFTANGAGCFIGGACVADGAIHPSNPCLQCSAANPTAWSNRPNGTSCNADSNGCTAGDACSSGQCQAGAAPNCDDGLGCTSDACTSTGPSSFSCTHSPAGNACVIGGACWSLGVVNPTNPCLSCSASQLTAWSAAPNGVSCNADNNGCTRNDTCQGGACSVGAAESCDDGKGCTADSCVSTGPASYVCSNSPNGNGCQIDGACWPFGARPAGNPCLVCSPSSLTGWSAAPSSDSCDDGNGCTSGDYCASGSCQPGAAVKCDDGLGCTADACVSVNNQPVCKNDLQSGCLIEGACYNAGDIKADETCLSCDPGASQYSWSPVPDGSSCYEAECGSCYSGSCYQETHYCTPYYDYYCSYAQYFCGPCPGGWYDCYYLPY